MTPFQKSSRNRLTLEQQLAVCKHAKKVRTKEPFANVALAAWATRKFNLPTPLSRHAVRKIVEREAELAAVPSPQLSRKTVLADHYRAADECIMSVFRKMDGVVESITGDVIRVIAVHANPEAGPSEPDLSNGWLYRLQRRQGISLKRKHGEAGSVDQDTLNAGRDKMRKLTLPYAHSDIYNMGETSFFFRSDARTALSTKKKVSSNKDPKNRVTLALAVNADGSDKLPPLYIGSAAVPRPLKGHNVREELGVIYTHSQKAWMNSSIFLSWLDGVNEKMRSEGRKILLLVDNASSHVEPAFAMSNVRLEFLPKNMIACVQPLDQGIIRATKSKYARTKVLDSVSRFFDGRLQEKVDIYTALRWSKQAWNDVTLETIQNCWRHAGILSDRSKVSAILN